MALLFVHYCCSYGITEIVIRTATADDFPDIGLPVTQQTGTEASLRGQAQPVAAVAKMMADWADETDSAMPACIIENLKYSGRPLGLLPFHRG